MEKFTVIQEFCGIPVGTIHESVPKEFQNQLVKEGFIRAYKKGDEKILTDKSEDSEV